MARVSTLTARTNLLRELKEQSAVLKDKPAKIKTLNHQLATAQKQNFPPAAISALEAEIARVQSMKADGLDQQIDALSRWISAEQDVARLFTKPAPKKRAPKAEGDVPKKRGRPKTT